MNIKLRTPVYINVLNNIVYRRGVLCMDTIDLKLKGKPGAQLYMFDPWQVKDKLIISGWLFEEKARLKTILKALFHALSVFPNAGQMKIFQERTSYFKVYGINYEDIELRSPWQTIYSQTDSFGQFRLELEMPTSLSFLNLMFRGSQFALKVSQLTPGSKDKLLISDIDDTIKITDVPRPVEALKNTFLRPFVAVPYISGLYSAFLTSSGNQIFYVSGAPWQLYDAVTHFLEDSGFPFVQNMCMRQFIPSTLESITNLWRQDTQNYKQETITRLVSEVLQHQGPIILIGDEGEKDPEVYEHIANRYEAQVEAIFIRVLDGSTDPQVQRVLRRFSLQNRGRVITFSTAEQLAFY